VSCEQKLLTSLEDDLMLYIELQQHTVMREVICVSSNKLHVSS